MRSFVLLLCLLPHTLASPVKTYTSDDGKTSWTPPQWASELSSRRDAPAGWSKNYAFKTSDATAGVQLRGSLNASVAAEGAALSAATTFELKVPHFDTNYMEVDAQVNLATAPCNVLDLKFTASASIKMNIGSDDSSCLLGNINQCIYDPLKDFGGGDYSKWATKWGSGIAGRYVKELTVPIGEFHREINFAAKIENLKFKLSTLMADLGSASPELLAISKFMAYTGTDVMWYVTPKSLSTMFTGVQFAITMEVIAFDLSKSTLPGISEMKKALGVAGMSSLVDNPLLDDKLDFLKLVAKYAPGEDIPSWINKDTGVVTIGEVSPECAKVPKDFGITIAGVPVSSLNKANVASALGKVLKDAATADQQKMMSAFDCTEQSFGLPLPGTGIGSLDGNKLSPSLICGLTGIAITGGRRGAPIKISGQANAGAGMNPGGINMALKAAIEKQGTISIAGASGKASGFTGDGCTAEERTNAGAHADAACGVAPAPPPTPSPSPPSPPSPSPPSPSPSPSPPSPSPSPPSPSPAPPGASSGGGLSTGVIVAIAAAAMVVVVIVGVGGAMYTGRLGNPFKSADGADYQAHTDADATNDLNAPISADAPEN